MFKLKINVSILNSKWVMIKKVELDAIPRKDEFIYMDEQYYIVLNVIHDLTSKPSLLVVVVDEFIPKIGDKYISNNQQLIEDMKKILKKA